MTRTLFLPGAGGSATFWKPVADRTRLEHVLLAWPGLGNEPAHSDVRGLDDLVLMVLRHMTQPVNIVAQSMGGLVALRAALAAPTMVRRLVLAATSGGVPVADLGGSAWQSEYYRTYPDAAPWIGTITEDLSSQLRFVAAPTLLLWGDHDPISPVAVGERLHTLLPRAALRVIPGADHDLAQQHAELVASLIVQHCEAGDSSPRPDRSPLP
ncbi:alpha/beta fold hydrolase [Deinococcus ruber]|uniref:Alpha/beta hydrolase n=1 Tax=Deinococcus ruber TaxID=1848197 RepID=A0A918C4M4_9DEIO|nr:alpha/beta hydrolase [Deinococcus ruber]GGR06526.1 alpha/beta hydrolase [Deinococcus ruber]